MKFLRFLIISAMLFCNFSAIAQTEPEKLNLPGDNLNLYAVLKLFQESATLEGFEKALNDSSSNINNLDLDGDNKIDYIRVIDNPDGDIHNITLKVDVNKEEEQDVAVFVVQKQADNKVQIQLIGDEDLYGKDYIIEPNMDDAAAGQTPNPGYSGNTTLANGETVTIETTTPDQIATWPVVSYIYVPTYVAWRSPWYWDYYPSYWRPWQPFFWHYYYGYHFHWEYYYYGHYRHWPVYRVSGWRDRYYGSNFHSRSPYVENRFRQGAYNNTYSRPQLARVGAASFRRDNPQAPSVHTRLPVFDKTGTPVTKPVVKPVTHPTRSPGTRPVKPVTTNPGIKPVPTRPVKQAPVKVSPTKPVKQETIKPVPTRPVKQAPIKPVPTRPVKQAPVRITPTQPVKQAPVRIAPTQPVRQAPVRVVPTNPVKQAPAPVRIAPAQPIRQQPVKQPGTSN